MIIRGHIYFVAVDEAAGARLYLLLDTAHVEALEGSVVAVAVLVGLIALGLSALLGVALSRAVMRPVTELASDVARLDPSKRNERLGKRFSNREVGVIARRIRRLHGAGSTGSSSASRHSRKTRATSCAHRWPSLQAPRSCSRRSQHLRRPARERVLRIRRATGQMQSLIEALLFLARGESGGAQSCALDQVVKEAVEMVAGGAALKSLQLNVQVEPVVVVGAPVMIACVVNNLLLNAVNFTREGSIDVRLTSAELTVHDTGIGIPPKDLSRIFERRYRGAQSRGLGLGLYLVSRICQRLGWTIETSSTESAGTTFRVLLRDRAAGG